MPGVVIELPSVLAQVVQGARRVELEASTLQGALQELVAQHPVLSVHLFEEGGSFREHVLCFHNGRNTRWQEDLSQPLAAGDTITILQAVSGG